MVKLPKEKWHQGWTEQTWHEHVFTLWLFSVFFFALGFSIAALLHL